MPLHQEDLHWQIFFLLCPIYRCCNFVLLLPFGAILVLLRDTDPSILARQDPKQRIIRTDSYGNNMNVSTRDKQRIRIGINGSPLGNTIASGIPRHIWEVSKRLDQLLPDAEFYLYTPQNVSLPAISDRWHIRFDPIPLLGKMKQNLWLKLRCGQLANKDNLDVFWSATSLLPRLPTSLPSCLTVFDLNLKIAPETMPLFTRLAFNIFFDKDIRSATKLLAGSKGTHDKIVQYYNRSSDGIVCCGYGDAFQKKQPAEVQAVLNKFDIAEPFCLAVGTLEPRKNIGNLLRAFEDLHNNGQLNGKSLVLVGKTGWLNQQDQELLDGFEKAPWLKRLGYVSDSDLAALYSGALLYVFPSIYEGFGIPVIEARACGARVAVTNIPELREHCGDNAVIISGTSPSAISSALSPVLSENHAYQSQDTAPLPTWDMAACTTRDVLLSAVNDQAHADKVALGQIA